MINKVLVSGYNDSGDFPAAAIVPQFRGGLDRDTLRKRASIFDAEYDNFERKPKHTYIHLISVAAGEQYGPNSRADFYNEKPYKHEFSQPEKDGPRFVVLKGGLQETHNKTFLKHGGVYTEHFSSLDGAKPQGYIVKAAINPKMHRGELIIGVKTDEWADDIQKLEEGHPMKFSIGATAPYDICSICGRVAHKESDHCEHYKNLPGAILDDGSQVYVISDNCLFHDISRVAHPAEKIAFSIRKVASGRSSRLSEVPITPDLSVVRDLCKTASAKNRFDALCKLAAIEKKINAVATAGKLDPSLISFFRKRRKAIGCHKKASDESLEKFLDFADQERIISSCNRHDYIMTPEEFVALMLPKEDIEAFHIDPEVVANDSSNIFNDILHSESADTFCADDTYELDKPCNPVTDARIGKYCKEVGIGDIVGELVEDAINDSDLQGGQKQIIITISGGVGKDINSAVAEDYASYLVSSSLRTSPEQVGLALLRNIIK